MSTYSDRHSAQKREPTVAKATEARRTHGSQQPQQELSEDQAEHLANKIMQVGSDYIVSKSEQRFSENEMEAGDSALYHGVDSEAVANKIMKEGARELARHEKHVHAGGDAAKAQSVASHRHDIHHPQHKVAEKIIEKLESEQQHALHNEFQGVNPTRGPNNSKLRHFRGTPGHEYVSTDYKREGNPDVLE